MASGVGDIYMATFVVASCWLKRLIDWKWLAEWDNSLNYVDLDDDDDYDENWVGFLMMVMLVEKSLKWVIWVIVNKWSDNQTLILMVNPPLEDNRDDYHDMQVIGRWWLMGKSSDDDYFVKQATG